MKKILITGIFGSCASYLVDYISQNESNIEIIGWGRNFASRKDQVNKLQKQGAKLREIDLKKYDQIQNAIQEDPLDCIFHIASNADVASSFSDPIGIMENNSLSFITLLEAIRAHNKYTRLILCSSSEVYGQVTAENIPISEKQLVNPMNPYAISKATQDFFANMYSKAYGLDIIRTRAFSYINARRGNLVASSFARQIALIELGELDALRHGNLESRRSFVDVRDIVHAYWLSYTKGITGEVYNIGGGHECTVQEMLATLLSYANCKIPTQLDPTLVRPLDITNQIPDCSKFQLATGWTPKISFSDSIEHLLKESREWAKSVASARSDRVSSAPI